MTEQESASSQPEEQSEKQYVRFDLYQRIQHLVFLISFTTLGITGLVQKYSESPISQGIMNALGGIEMTRLIHHAPAVVMIVVSIVHIIDVLYRLIVLRVSWSMAPVIEDFKHLYVDVKYFLSRRKHRDRDRRNRRKHPLPDHSLLEAPSCVLRPGRARAAQRRGCREASTNEVRDRCPSPANA